MGRAEERRVRVGREAAKMEMETGREMEGHQEKQLLSLLSSPGRLSCRMRTTFVVLQLPGTLIPGNDSILYWALEC